MKHSDHIDRILSDVSNILYMDAMALPFGDPRVRKIQDVSFLVTQLRYKISLIGAEDESQQVTNQADALPGSG